MKLPSQPPAWSIAADFSRARAEVFVRGLARVLEPEVGGEYVHWDELKRLEPPADLDHEMWWLLVARARRAIAREIPLRETVGGVSDGQPFLVAAPDTVQR